MRIKHKAMEAVWLSGWRIGFAIQWSRVRVPLCPLAGFVLGLPEFKSLATLVKQPAGCLLPVEVLNPVMLYLNNYLFSKYLQIVKRFGSLRERRYVRQKIVYYYYYYYYYYYSHQRVLQLRNLRSESYVCKRLRENKGQTWICRFNTR